MLGGWHIWLDWLAAIVWDDVKGCLLLQQSGPWCECVCALIVRLLSPLLGFWCCCLLISSSTRSIIVVGSTNVRTPIDKPWPIALKKERERETGVYRSEGRERRATVEQCTTIADWVMEWVMRTTLDFEPHWWVSLSLELVAWLVVSHSLTLPLPQFMYNMRWSWSWRFGCCWCKRERERERTGETERCLRRQMHNRVE